MGVIKHCYKKYEIEVTMACAGNRISEMTKHGFIHSSSSPSWGSGAISTGVFGGAKLSEVLRDAGVLEGSNYHVEFIGLDYSKVANDHYGCSIPLRKALDPNEDVLLAYELNGKPLTVDNGFPVRVVVPGYIGARSVKWLK